MIHRGAHPPRLEAGGILSVLGLGRPAARIPSSNGAGGVLDAEKVRQERIGTTRHPSDILGA